jgi:hypothetical protein
MIYLRLTSYRIDYWFAVLIHYGDKCVKRADTPPSIVVVNGIIRSRWWERRKPY